MSDTGRETQDVDIEDAGMMSTAMNWQSWGEAEAPYEGLAEGISISFYVHLNIAGIFGVESSNDLTQEQEQAAWGAVREALGAYKGYEDGFGGDDPAVQRVTFALAYKDNETDDEMIGRLDTETDFNRLYNDGVIFFHLEREVARILGFRHVRDDFDGDRYVPIDDVTTPDMYYRNGERELVMPR